MYGDVEHIQRLLAGKDTHTKASYKVGYKAGNHDIYWSTNGDGPELFDDRVEAALLAEILNDDEKLRPQNTLNKWEVYSE